MPQALAGRTQLPLGRERYTKERLVLSARCHELQPDRHTVSIDSDRDADRREPEHADRVRGPEDRGIRLAISIEVGEIAHGWWGYDVGGQQEDVRVIEKFVGLVRHSAMVRQRGLVLGVIGWQPLLDPGPDDGMQDVQPSGQLTLEEGTAFGRGDRTATCGELEPVVEESTVDLDEIAGAAAQVRDH